MKTKKLKSGDKVYSKYFGGEIEIMEVFSDTDWYFRTQDGRLLKAQTPLSYFENQQT